jgi:hypothetical protein
MLAMFPGLREEQLPRGKAWRRAGHRRRAAEWAVESIVVNMPLPTGATPVSALSILRACWRKRSETLNGVETDETLARADGDVPVLPDPRKFKLGGTVLAETLKTYLGLFPDCEECLGQNGLIRDVDLIVTSVGPPLPVSPITRWIFDLAGFDIGLRSLSLALHHVGCVS